MHYCNLKGKQKFVIRVWKQEPLFYRKGPGMKAQPQSELNLNNWHIKHISATLFHPVVQPTAHSNSNYKTYNISVPAKLSMCENKTFQSNRKFHITTSNHILDFEVKELCLWCKKKIIHVHNCSLNNAKSSVKPQMCFTSAVKNS